MSIIKNYSEATASFGIVIISGSLIMTGSSSGSFTGSLSGSVSGYLSGSFNGYSGSLSWLDTFASSSNSGSFTGSFTGSLNGSSSYATTSSYTQNIKSGVIRFDQWAGDLIGEYTSSVTFSTAYANTSYSVTLTCGSDIRTLTVISKLSTGFTVSSNSTSAMTDNVYWVCVPYNNP
jgi:hypothetical protein